MKLAHIIEDSNRPTAVSQAHQLLFELRKIVKEIPSELEITDDGELDYPRLLTDKSGIFNDHGKCMVECAEQILDHVKTEKVVLLVGGYDGDYEQFFESTGDEELLVKRNPKDTDSFFVRFSGDTFTLTREVFIDVFDDFLGQKRGPYWYTEYDRPDGLQEPDYDEDYPRRRSWHSHSYHDDYEPTADDYKLKKCRLGGGLLYKDLHV